MPYSTLYSCPVGDCRWEYAEPPGKARTYEEFSRTPLLYPLEEYRERVAKTEAALQAHMDTHTTVDFARTIRDLERELAGARALQQPAKVGDYPAPGMCGACQFGGSCGNVQCGPQITC